ncbi:ABC transporter permease [Sphaerisporangium sp. NPDC051017]|uniref:ABC transporter permease n=1 Tax=Sphaerisporangium sp. NPDC051017 TaxID=3154636 RepID=UPI00343A2973
MRTADEPTAEPRLPAPEASRRARWSATSAGAAIRDVARLLIVRVSLLVTLLAIVFAAVELLPGDAATATAERGESAAGLAARRHLLGLDQPLWTRFATWMTALPSGNLGVSARGRPVTEVLADPFPNTLVLALSALVLTVLASLALGCWAAARPGGLTDRVIGHLATSAFALPEYIVAIALVLPLALWTGLLPAVTVTDATGAPGSWTMLVMPVLALTIPQTGWNTRIVRGALADQAALPHVEAAGLDGLPAHVVVLRHALPGAVPTIAAGIATSAGMLFGGAVVVETLFNYPGVGTLLAGAVSDRDTPLVAGVAVCAGAAITIVLLASDVIRDVVVGGRR